MKKNTLGRVSLFAILRFNGQTLNLLTIFFAIIMCISKAHANNSIATAILVDNEQRLVLVGSANNAQNAGDTSQTASTDAAIARLNQDGSLDATFNSTAIQPGRLQFDVQGTNDGLTAVALDRSNNIVVAGFTSNNLINQMLVARIIPTGPRAGQLDQSFNQGATAPEQPGLVIIPLGPFGATATGVAVDSQNRIVVVGTRDTESISEIVVVRLNSDGTLDETFNAGSTTPGIFTLNIMNTNQIATGVAIDKVDNIYVSGSVRNGLLTEFLLVKLLPSGTLDVEGFNPGSLFPGMALLNLRPISVLDDGNDAALALVIDNNGKIVLGGTSGVGPVETDFALARFNPDGSLDESFNRQGLPAPNNPQGLPQGQPGVVITKISGETDSITGLTIDNAQRIVATGFSTVGSDVQTGAHPAFTTARYINDGINDGLLDTTFSNNGPMNGVVITDVVPTNAFSGLGNSAAGVVIGNDGNIFVTGVSNDGSQNNFTTISYLTTGSLNPNFTAFDSEVEGIVITRFGLQQNLGGNGVPLFLGGDVSGIDPQLVESIRTIPTLIEPQIIHEGPLIAGELPPTLNGISAPNALITIYVDTIPLTNTIADANGAWSVTMPALPEGNYQVTVQAVDPLTSLSLASAPLPLAVKITKPMVPIIETPQSESIIRSKGVKMQGRAEPLAAVGVFYTDEKGGQIEAGNAQANERGRWTLTIEQLSDGMYQFFAASTDQAGNLSEFSAPLSITIQTQQARTPRILSPKSGFNANKRTIAVEGEGQPGNTVNVYVNNAFSKAVEVNAQGRWKHTLTNLKDGSYRLYATTADKQRSSAVVNLTVDTVPPKPATILPRKPSTGALKPGLINGKAEPQSTIKLKIDGRIVGTVQADDQGFWGYSPTVDQPLSRGRHLVQVSVADKAGNVSRLIEQSVQI